MRGLVPCSLLVMVVAALFAAGPAEAQPDSGFGQAGVLPLSPPVPSGWRQQEILGAATGSDGQVFVAARQLHCEPTGCPGSREFIFNYLANGSLTSSFGGPRGYEVPIFSPSAGVASIAVSTSGSPLVAAVTPVLAPSSTGTIQVQRLLPSGALDTGFGSGGTASIPCDCHYGNAQIFAGPENTTMAIVKEEVEAGGGVARGATISKLNAAGQAASAYGSAGSKTIRVPGKGTLGLQALAPGGAAYFGGVDKSGKAPRNTLTKVSASGKVDQQYSRTAAKSLELLAIPASEGLMEPLAAVAAKDGSVTLFGAAGKTGGFELKLRPSGKPETKFAKQGLRRLNRRIVAAVAGSEGAAMTLAVGSSTRVLRLLADGRPDPKFGKPGEELPGLTGSGLSLAPAGTGKVDVVDLGLTECRGICQVDPKVYRFLED
jgi:serralysin